MTGPIIIPEEAHPLSWPPTVPRSKTTRTSRFVAPTIAGGLKEIREELRRMGATKVVISSNIPLRQTDGQPVSRAFNLDDHGVAVYWQMYRGKQLVPYCLPCDRWRTVAENLHAIAKTVKALRDVERWGAIQVVQAFEGFKALPSGDPIVTPPPWRETLGGNWPTRPDGSPLPNEELLGVVRGRFRALMKTVHPNSGNETTDPNVSARVAELTAARDAAEEELKA
jgi:hypothetical protein